MPGAAPAGTVTLHVVVAVWPGTTWENVVGEVAATVHPSGAVRLTLTCESAWLPVSGSDVVTVAVAPGAMMGGAFTENGCCTATGAEPVTPFTVTLMVAAPCAIAVSLPPGLTVTTLGLLLL